MKQVTLHEMLQRAAKSEMTLSHMLTPIPGTSSSLKNIDEEELEILKLLEVGRLSTTPEPMHDH